MMNRYEKQPSIRHAEPPRGGGKIRYEVKGIPVAKNLMGFCLSERPHGQEGHWNGNTARPHDPIDCEWCMKKMGWKWQGFLFAWNPAVQEIFVVRFPQGVWGAIQEALKIHGTLRGLKFCFWRPKGFATAPTAARFSKIDSPLMYLPDCPDMDEFLNRLFYGGWFGNGSSQAPTDPAGEQLQFLDNLPPGVLPVNRVVDQIIGHNKTNGTLRK